MGTNEELEGSQMTVMCMITLQTLDQNRLVILIGFARQQWYHEHASMSHYMYITCLIRIFKLDY
jgi:hypothetical protein